MAEDFIDFARLIASFARDLAGAGYARGNSMMKFVAACAAVLLSSAAVSQAVILSAVPAGTAVLRLGTAVPMRLTEDLTTKGKLLKVGQRIRLEVAEAVMMNGQIVIPVGTPGMGELTTVRNKGMFGKSGLIQGRVMWVRVGDRQIRMSGNFDDKGVAGGIGPGSRPMRRS